MSIRERLKLAYENAAFGADKTWSSGFHNLQKTNLDLLLRESHIQESFNADARPRTVRDSIPNSRLAQYSDYPYNNSRELSYAGDFRQVTWVPLYFKDDTVKEPWMHDTVEYYCRFYMEYFTSARSLDEKPPARTFESPFLKVGSLPEYFLKLGLFSEQVKRLWDTKSYDTGSFMYRTASPRGCSKSLLLYKAPTRRVVYAEHDDHNLTFTDVHKEYAKDEGHLNLLAASFKQHQQQISTVDAQAITCTVEHSQNKRLYSAVLQGYSSSKLPPPPTEGQMTILKRTITKNDRTVQVGGTGSISDLSKRKVDGGTADQNVAGLKQCLHLDVPKVTSHNVLMWGTPVFTPAGTSSSGGGSIIPANHFIPRINAARLLASALVAAPQQVVPTQSLVPQNLVPFCHPLLIHRTLHNLERNVATTALSVPAYHQCAANIFTPNQFLPSTSYRHDPHTFKPKVKTKPMNATTKRTSSSGVTLSGTVRKNMKLDSVSSCSFGSHASKATSTDMDQEVNELVSRTIDIVLRESEPENIFPVTGSLSDELERQALEQYNSSNDNVYQELERQAVEEYEGSSENYKNPPNYSICSGGFLTLIFLFFKR